MQKSRTLFYIVLIFIVHAAVLSEMGQPFWCKCGEWYPWVSSAWSSHTSQHLFDPYSFSHLQHGLFFYFFLRLIRVPPKYRMWVALGIEVAWEIAENSPFVIGRYRTATAAFDYFGDSIANSLSDLFCCLTGFVLASKCRWQLSVLVYLVIEVGMLVYINDSLTLNVLMLIYPIEAVKRWQIPVALQ